MHSSTGSFEMGKWHLSHHRPRIALEYFRKALRSCPVDDRRELIKTLFYTGIVLKKVGLPSSALKTWLTARSLDKRSYAGKMVERYINDYGMLRQMTSELDDWNAFYSVQLKKYLESKRSRKIGSQGEKDMIWDLIFEYWQGIVRSDVLRGKSNSEKLALFTDVEIIFPYFSPPEEKHEIIHVDFFSRSRISADDPCPCRSGLTYRQCCGRIKCDEELLYGLF
ncbi:SEC-C metal-binding domain-containing protein [Marispirochaeta sp.]|uniref:YecA family protein n=1 Tax=Marispirochaeta sp. TaxID=2038653 RepID=UPI0029C76ED2|nr:SEC-C metal-binding domain-containing protein [Marispirochaeta sp.]